MNKEKILVVDDTPTNLEVLKEHRGLAQAIQREVDEFDFDRLMNLAQEAVNL